MAENLMSAYYALAPLFLSLNLAVAQRSSPLTIGSVGSGYRIQQTNEFDGSPVLTTQGNSNIYPIYISTTSSSLNEMANISNAAVTLNIAPAQSCDNTIGNGSVLVWAERPYKWQILGHDGHYVFRDPVNNLTWSDNTTHGHIILITPPPNPDLWDIHAYA